MKQLFIFVSIFSFLILISSCGVTNRNSGWGYSSDQGGFEQVSAEDRYFREDAIKISPEVFESVPSVGGGVETLNNRKNSNSSSDVNSNKEGNSDTSERKLTYSANLDLIVKENANTVDALDSIAKTYKGYVQNGSNDYITIKVESERLEAALESIETLGKVEGLRISTADVSEYYLDSEIRLDNARKARARYLELLDQAENVEAALLVERELERVNGIIDLYSGKLNKLNDQIRYANIQITVKEKVKLGPLGFISKGIYKSVKWLFVRN